MTPVLIPSQLYHHLALSLPQKTTPARHAKSFHNTVTTKTIILLLLHKTITAHVCLHVNWVNFMGVCTLTLYVKLQLISKYKHPTDKKMESC